ncbi:MAG: aspartate aminotransferase family protein [Candidatus Nezhaarchaeales archaeon]
MSDKSKELFEEAKKFLPGGVTYSLRFFEPYPIYIRRAKGSRLWDVNGNEYLDFWMSHGAVVVGHNYEPIMKAVKEQLEYGIHLGWCNEWEVKWAKAICSWFNTDMARPTNSGTEANMYAVRLARAYTKKVKIGKFEGGWHGGYDALHKGVSYPYDKLASLGLVEDAMKDTVLLPFNDLEGVRRIIKGLDLAAIIVEPVIGVAGNIPANREFLKGLREICYEKDALLIFDEVITGFRFYKGAQHYYGVKPDITTTGKAVGGQYFPGAGAFCGRADVMELLDQIKRPYFWERVFHGGTYTGNTLTMRAGYTLIEELERNRESIYNHLEELGNLMKEGLEEVFSKNNFEAYVTGLGSLLGIHFTKERPINGLTAERTKNSVIAEKLFHYMINNGVLYQTPVKPYIFLSTAHTKEDVERFLTLMNGFIKNL